jgi:uncharacterized protein (DUF58 family)
MIIPRDRLIYGALLLLPFLALTAASPLSVWISYGLVIAFIILVVTDASLTTQVLKGLAVSSPEVVRFSKNREGQIPLIITNESMASRQLRLALALESTLHPTKEYLEILLPHQVRESQVYWPCVPKNRGQFLLKDCYVETASPLGFWDVRKRLDCRSQIRVYPNLQEDRKQLASIFLNRGNVGLHAQRFVGQGREFEKLRDYVPGDSYDQIFWKATAKRGRPITKVFQIERTQEIYVFVDFSRLSGKMMGSEPALERFVSAALILGLVAEKQGDLFGLATYSDQVRNFVRAKNGKAHYHTCRDTLYHLQTQMVTPNFEEICSFIRLRLRRRALLFFLTDLHDPEMMQTLPQHLELLCRQHLVLLATLQSPEIQPIFGKSPVKTVDQIYQRLGGHLLWHQLQELEKNLHHMGVKLLQLEHEKLGAELVNQYLKIKERQLL